MIWLDQDYFNYATGLRMTEDEKWERLFGLKRRVASDEMLNEHCDMALAIQQVTEEVFIKMAKEAQRLSGSKNICLAGGVALNSVANGKLIDLGIFDNVYIQPAAGDAGGAVGAALAAYHIHEGHEREVIQPDAMTGSLLGSEYTDAEIEVVLNKMKIKHTRLEDEPTFIDRVGTLITEANVIGWFQGRMEFGPRALGARSIIADARSPEMQKKVNLKINNGISTLKNHRHICFKYINGGRNGIMNFLKITLSYPGKRNWILFVQNSPQLRMSTCRVEFKL